MSDNCKLRIDEEKIADFCGRSKITETALFGAVLRHDFSLDSDVDLLVTFGSDAHWGIFDIIGMEEELSQLLERKVDLVSRRAIERSPNWIRRKAILTGARSLSMSRDGATVLDMLRAIMRCNH